MFTGDGGSQVWIALTSTQTVPYGFAASVSLAIGVLAGAAALGRRAQVAHGRAKAKERWSPTVAPIRRSRPRVSLSDMASVHLTSVGSDAQTRHSNGAEGAQAPSSIGLSPCSPDPLLATSGIGEESSSSEPTASPNGSAGKELPHEATSDGPG